MINSTKDDDTHESEPSSSDYNETGTDWDKEQPKKCILISSDEGVSSIIKRDFMSPCEYPNQMMAIIYQMMIIMSVTWLYQKTDWSRKLKMENGDNMANPVLLRLSKKLLYMRR